MKRIENIKEMIPGKRYMIEWDDIINIITFKSINCAVIKHDKIFKKDYTEEDMLNIKEWYINTEEFNDELGERIDFFDNDIYELDEVLREQEEKLTKEFLTYMKNNEMSFDDAADNFYADNLVKFQDEKGLELMWWPELKEDGSIICVIQEI